MNDIKKRIASFKEKNDVHQYSVLLKIADDFIMTFSNGVNEGEELDLGIDLLRELISINYIFSFKEYEGNFDLDKEIRYKKIKIFKLCIPTSHAKLRGMTELLLGMRENIVG